MVDGFHSLKGVSMVHLNPIFILLSALAPNKKPLPEWHKFNNNHIKIIIIE